MEGVELLYDGDYAGSSFSYQVYNEWMFQEKNIIELIIELLDVSEEKISFTFLGDFLSFFLFFF